jgi:signal transduction histidine kinase
MVGRRRKHQIMESQPNINPNSNKKLEALISAIEKMASGDFSFSLPISDDRDSYDAMAAGINMLVEELRVKNLQIQADLKEIGKTRAIFYSLAEDIQEEKEKVEARVKARTKEISENLSRMQSLVEAIRLGVVMVDLSHNVILANVAAKAMFGKFPGETLTFAEIEKKLQTASISQTLSVYIEEGKPMNTQEVIFNDRTLRLFLSPVRDINEKYFIGAVMIAEDITEQKLLDKMRTEIVSITSHQLRTPLAVIKGNLEMVLGGDIGELNKDQKEVLEEAAMGNNRMIKLVNQLMDVSKVTEKKLELHMVFVQLEDLVSESVKELLPLAEQNKVKIIYNHPAKPLMKVNVDLIRIKQILQNLIDNAIKYVKGMPEAQIQIEVKEDGSNLKLSVSDNGVGIPKLEQPKIFERFFRASNVTQLDPGGGTGLGLYIAKAIIEQLGGRLWFESEGENKGTVFIFSLPGKKQDFEEAVKDNPLSKIKK